MQHDLEKVKAFRMLFYLMQPAKHDKLDLVKSQNRKEDGFGMFHQNKWIAAVLLLALLSLAGLQSATAAAATPATVYMDDLRVGQRIEAGTVFGYVESGTDHAYEGALIINGELYMREKLKKWTNSKWASVDSLTASCDLEVKAVMTGKGWFRIYPDGDSSDPSKAVFMIFDSYETFVPNTNADITTHCRYYDGKEVQPITVMMKENTENKDKVELQNYSCTIGTKEYKNDKNSITPSDETVYLVILGDPTPAATEPHYYPNYDSTPDSETIAPESTVTTAYRVTCRTLNVRSTPSTKLARIGRVHRGDSLKVLEIVNGWAKIEYNDGIAYVCAKYITQ